MSINMHSSKHNQLASFTRKTLSAAVVSVMLGGSAYAAGLGKLTVLSGLGQPLRAEIELTAVSKEEEGTIVAKLASADAYRQANIEFNPALFSLRFAIENRGSRHFIRVSSSQPMNEPFVAMLVEVGGTRNRLVREYTFLLDPVDLRRGQATQIAATPTTPARPAAAPAARGVTTEDRGIRTTVVAQQEATQRPLPAQTQPAPARRAAPVESRTAAASPAATASPAAESDDSYKVKQGDTLASIAGQVKPEGVSLDQMLVALYRNNPNAFAGNNMNRLRAGQILTVPNADAAKAVGKSEARSVIVAQSADFNAYRNKLAGQVAASTQGQGAEASQSAGGKITTQVEDKAGTAADSKDKLKLSNAGASKDAGSGAGAGKGTVSSEDLIAKERALAEANARVKELERNVTDLQKLLEIKNKDLAAQQAQAQAQAQAAAKPAAGAAAPVTPAVPAQPAPAASTPPAADAAAQPATPAGQAAAPAEAPSATPAEGQPGATDAQQPADQAAADSAAEAASPAEGAAPAAETAPEPEAKPVAPPPPPPVETSFIDDLLGNPLLLAAVGGVLVAGLAAFGIFSRRRKKAAEAYDDSMLADSSLKANSLFGSTGGQSVDTSNSVFNSSFAPAVSQLDTNEVDPVAEADVYIAYGRDAQAEEILKEALRTQPERHAVRLKLLEIYSGRNDVRAFETLATELYSMTKGEGEAWQEAAAMGVALDPNNPLYAGAQASAATGDGAAAGDVAEEDATLDELLSTADPNGALGVNSTYFDDTMHAVSPAPAPAAEPAASSNSLDFDLDGLSAAAPQAPAPAPAPKAAADSGVMDFDLELPQSFAAAPTATGGDLHADDLAFNVPEVPSLSQAKPAAAPAQAASLDIDLSDISLDLGAPTTAPVAEAPTLEFSTGDTRFDLTQSAADFDAPQGGFEDSLITEADAEATPDSEMATKLDLAIAYQEIGDREGARELLDEVIKGGNPEQSEKARSLLHSLA